MNAIEIHNLTKTYDGFTLHDLNLSLPSGCIMGLIGENGAGKSTTIKLILDMIHKNNGTITILGKDNTDNFTLTKEDVGVVLDEVGLPDCLNLKQINSVMKYTFQHWDEDEFHKLSQKFSLPNNKSFKDFSRGMKMKTGIAVALSHGSKLLLLDEATSGLDPVVRDEILDIFSEFTRDETHSILISSHIVSDLEKLCDYIAFLHEGKLLLCEEKDKLLSEYGILHCSKEQLADINPNGLLYTKESPYGVEVIVKRSCIPQDLTISPISIEELFVFMVKGGK